MMQLHTVYILLYYKIQVYIKLNMFIVHILHIHIHSTHTLLIVHIYF